MADKTVSLELKIDASGAATSVGDLKKSIVDLKNQALKVGEDTPLGRQFIADAGKAKDRLSDLTNQVDSFQDAGSKFGAVTKLVGSLAGGFQAAQGAAALFGSSGEDLQKVLVKVQAATALAQGAQALAGITDDIAAVKKIALAAASGTYSTVVGVATGKIKIATLAQQAWNAMMALNPIGLVITAIALMTSAIYMLVTAESEEEKQLKKVNKELEYNNDERERDISYIKEQQRQTQKLYENELRLMKINGATEEEINAKKFEHIDRGLKSNEELILQEKKKIENNEKLIAGLPPIKARTQEQLLLHEKYAGVIEKSNISIFDLTQANDDLNISYQELANSLNGATESQEADLEAKKKQAEYLQKQKEYYISLSAAGEPGSIGYYNFLLSQSNERLEKLVPGSKSYNDELTKQLNLTKQLAVAQANAFLEQQKQKGLTGPVVGANDAVEFPPELKQELSFDELMKQLELEQELSFQDNKTEIHKKAIAERKAITKIDFQQAVKLAEQGAAALQGLGDAVFANKLAKVKKGGAEEQKIIKQQFEFNKKLQLAGAIIDGAKAVISSLAQSPVAIGPIPNPAGIASLALVAVSTAASIAKIAATKFDSSGGALSTPSFSAGSLPDVGGAPNLEGNQPNTNIPGANGNSNSTKVYVTETDIKRVTNRVNVIESRATFR